MHGVEMQRHSIAARSITDNRYDLVYQPVANRIEHPRLKSAAIDFDEDRLLGLLKIMDRLAVDFVKASLKDDVSEDVRL
jgi:hypothetical protein